MARTLGTYSLSANIEMLAGAPLDAREIVPAKADLTTSGMFPYAYIGMETYVVAENKKYRLIGIDPTVSSNWEEIKAGSEITPNPSDQATDDLSTIKINNTVYSIVDPTVPSWAKASSKPSYTFSEIGSTPTTLSGYGITDAKIVNGTITLGSNTITPITDISGKADKSATVSTVAWDSSNNKLTKTINGSTTDVVTASTILNNLIGNQVTSALGYTPAADAIGDINWTVIGHYVIPSQGPDSIALNTYISRLSTAFETAINDHADWIDNIDSTKLPKTTYEYNKEVTFGSSGKLLIGKFPCYDSNVTITINATTSVTYHCTAVLATQNINTSGGGVFKWETYDDASNTITPNLYAKYVSGSNVVEIYFSPSSWSKNLVHIQCVALAAAPTNICESVSSIPSEATRQPSNKLVSTYLPLAGGTLTGSLTTRSINPAINSSATIGDERAYESVNAKTGYFRAVELQYPGNNGSIYFRDSSNTSNYIQLTTTGNNSTDTIYLPSGKTGTIALTSDLSSYLPLAGGTMTGSLTFSAANTSAIKYAGTKQTYAMIKFKDNTNDTYGNGIIIGGGGLTIIGGGESADTVSAQYSSGGDESMIIANDGAVTILSNVNNGYASRKIFTFGTNGVLTADGFSGPLTGNVTGNCSGSSGSCTGNAATATTATKLGTSTVGGTTTPIYLNAGVPTALSYTIAKSVPSDAVFTDTNTKVTQTATSTNADYEVLFSATADNTTRTEGARKYSNLKFNPSTGNLQATQLNGVAIGSSPKFTDTNTTYTIATGDNNGQIKVTPSGGTAYNVGVKGLGTAAYTASTAYASSSHSHNYITFGSNTANRFTANRITYFGWNGRPYIIIDGSSTYYLSGSWS